MWMNVRLFGRLSSSFSVRSQNSAALREACASHVAQRLACATETCLARKQILGLGVAIWNQWRRTNLGLRPDPSRVDLAGRDLVNVDFYQTDLRSTKLIGAKLINANLNGTDLRSADRTWECLLGASQAEVLAFIQMHGAIFEDVLE